MTETPSHIDRTKLSNTPNHGDFYEGSKPCATGGDGGGNGCGKSLGEDCVGDGGKAKAFWLRLIIKGLMALKEGEAGSGIKIIAGER
jgi:hypothetical protein